MIKNLLKNPFLLSAIFILLLQASPALAKNLITKLSISEQRDKLIFELRDLPKYRAYLSGDKLVIDFQDCEVAANIKIPAHKSFAGGSFTKNSNDLRLAINLKDKIKIDKILLISLPAQKKYQLGVSLILAKPVAAKPVVAKPVVAKPNPALPPKKIYTLTPLNSEIADRILSEEKKPETPIIPLKEPKKIKSPPIIVIDAGHGGKDPGTIGDYTRVKEKNVTLAYARELKKQLDKTGRYNTFLTRDNDYFISLRERVEKSRKLRAHLFISLHADSNNNSKTTGLSIYTLSELSSDKQAEILAQKENKSDIIGGVNFEGASGEILSTLINLSQRQSMNNSALFAEIAIKNMEKNGVHILQNTHRFAGFRVLTAPDVAAVLIELGYLSNKDEEKKLVTLGHRKKIAESLLRSIDDYFTKVKE